MGVTLDALKTERDVVALVAHELRQPLAAIEGALRLLGESQPPSRRERAARVVERQVACLRRLVDDLVHAERIRRQGLTLERTLIDLRTVIREGMRTCAEAARRRGVVLVTRLPRQPVMMSGDAVRLQQVVSNVVDNAVRHTDAGGRIRVHLETAGGHAVLSVRNTGQGIPGDVLPWIFEAFQRHGSAGGLGIGLYVARHLVELHGGRITAHSTGPGAGAEFVIVLPTNRSETDRSFSASTATPG